MCAYFQKLCQRFYEPRLVFRKWRLRDCKRLVQDETAFSVRFGFTLKFLEDCLLTTKESSKEGKDRLTKNQRYSLLFSVHTDLSHWWTREQLALSRSSLYICYTNKKTSDNSPWNLLCSSANSKRQKSNIPLLLRCSAAGRPAFHRGTCFPGAPEPIYSPSVSCLPKAILLHPRRFRFSQLERGETLKDIQETPETLQVGGEDKQVHEPSNMISDLSALKHALAWLVLAWESPIQGDLCLGACGGWQGVGGGRNQTDFAPCKHTRGCYGWKANSERWWKPVPLICVKQDLELRLLRALGDPPVSLNMFSDLPLWSKNIWKSVV